jgi:hypothetical protein
LAAIGSAIASLFLLPPAFGVAGVVLGAWAVRRGERRLGWIAIVLSVVLAVFSTWLALQLVHRI